MENQQTGNELQFNKTSLSTAQLQHLIDSLSAIVFTLDREGRFTFVNQTASDVFGYSPEEMYGFSCFDLILEEDRDKTITFFEQLISGKDIIHFENVFRCKDGGIVPTSWAARWDDHDCLIYCTIRDITERRQIMELRKKYQHELEKQNQEMSDILKRITDGFIVMDDRWSIIYANRQALNMINCTFDQVYQKNVWECFPNARGTLFEEQYHKALSEQVSVHFEAFYTEPLNTWFEINAYPSISGLSIYFRNITERKKNEEAIQKLSLVAKETNNAVCMVELNGTISWINGAFTKITGYYTEEATGFKISELLLDEVSDCLTIIKIDELFGKGASFREEVVCFTKTKEKTWLEISGQPIFDPGGSIQSYFFILSDISERKLLEQKLERERKKMTGAVLAAQEQERAYVGQELHDNVNQILTTVKLYTELIHDGIGITKELASKSIQLLQDSINEIRSLSKRLSSPTQQGIKFKDHIQELVDSVIATNKIDIELDMCIVETIDINQELQLTLYRIIQEHLTNILKHANAQVVRVTFNCVDNDLVLKITDNGSGFDTKQKRKGIGITNMITRAENSNGTLKINSAPGLGCVLIARFPLQKKSENIKRRNSHK
jgi:PAS domain S-box-containing protein